MSKTILLNEEQALKIIAIISNSLPAREIKKDKRAKLYSYYEDIEWDIAHQLGGLDLHEVGVDVETLEVKHYKDMIKDDEIDCEGVNNILEGIKVDINIGQNAIKNLIAK